MFHLGYLEIYSKHTIEGGDRPAGRPIERTWRPLGRPVDLDDRPPVHVMHGCMSWWKISRSQNSFGMHHWRQIMHVSSGPQSYISLVPRKHACMQFCSVLVSLFISMANILKVIPMANWFTLFHHKDYLPTPGLVFWATGHQKKLPTATQSTYWSDLSCSLPLL